MSKRYPVDVWTRLEAGKRDGGYGHLLGQGQPTVVRKARGAKAPKPPKLSEELPQAFYDGDLMSRAARGAFRVTEDAKGPGGLKDMGRYTIPVDLAPWSELDDYGHSRRLERKFPDDVSVYALVDKRGLIRYVGSTSRPLPARMKEHRKRRFPDVAPLMREGGATIRLITYVQASDRYRCERSWIRAVAKIGVLLNRRTNGGLLAPILDRKERTTRIEAAEIAAKSGPVRVLSRAEIEQLYGRT